MLFFGNFRVIGGGSHQTNEIEQTFPDSFFFTVDGWGWNGRGRLFLELLSVGRQPGGACQSNGWSAAAGRWKCGGTVQGIFMNKYKSYWSSAKSLMGPSGGGGRAGVRLRRAARLIFRGRPLPESARVNGLSRPFGAGVGGAVTRTRRHRRAFSIGPDRRPSKKRRSSSHSLDSADRYGGHFSAPKKRDRYRFDFHFAHSAVSRSTQTIAATGIDPRSVWSHLSTFRASLVAVLLCQEKTCRFFSHTTRFQTDHHHPFCLVAAKRLRPVLSVNRTAFKLWRF